MNHLHRSVLALSLGTGCIAQTIQPPPELELQLNVIEDSFCEVVVGVATTEPAQGVFFMPQAAVYVDPAHPAGAEYFAKYEDRGFLLQPLPTTFADHGLDQGRDYSGYPSIGVPIEPVVAWHSSQLLAPQNEFVRIREVGIPMLRGGSTRAFLPDYARYDLATAATWKPIQAFGYDGLGRETLVLADLIELAVYRQSGGLMFDGDWATDNEEYYDFFTLFEAGAATLWIQLFGNRSGLADPAYPATDPEIDPNNQLLVGTAGPYTLSAASAVTGVVIQVNDGSGTIMPSRVDPVTVPFVARPQSAASVNVVESGRRGQRVRVPIAARGPDVFVEMKSVSGPYRRWVRVEANGPGGSVARIPLDAPISAVAPGGGPGPSLELTRLQDAYGDVYQIPAGMRLRLAVLP